MGWEIKVPAQTKLWSSWGRYQATFRALLTCPKARYRTPKCSHKTPYELTLPSLIRSWDRLLHPPRDHERDIAVTNNKIIKNILNLHNQGSISKAPTFHEGGLVQGCVMFVLHWCDTLGWKCFIGMKTLPAACLYCSIPGLFVLNLPTERDNMSVRVALKSLIRMIAQMN